MHPIASLDRWQRLALLAWLVLVAGVSARVLLRPGQQTVYPIFAQAGRDWRAGADVYPLYDRSGGGEPRVVAVSCADLRAIKGLGECAPGLRAHARIDAAGAGAAPA